MPGPSRTRSLLLLAATLVGLGLAAESLRAADQHDLTLTLKSQRETALNSGLFVPVERTETWRPAETAIIVCDVWDLHHSLNAVQRIAEFGPRLNSLLDKARSQGVTILHAPSDCMAPYVDHPARQRAQAAPKAPRQPHDIAHWCSKIPAEERIAYPIDQSDGGDDDAPDEHREWAAKLVRLGRNPGLPWQRQSDLITIDSDRDYLSDRGDEVWNVLESRGIRNVILTGVHLNMCVLGRPFGLRQMARNGKNVVLMRDLTDTMYNPRQWPYVSHFSGTDQMVSHVERYVCPTVTSDQILGGQPFRFANDSRPHVVIVIAEEGYRTAKTLPDFARRFLEKDLRVTVLHSDGQLPARIPGLSAIRGADLLVLSVRRQALPAEDLDLLQAYVRSGRPVIGLRTSSHAFSLNGKPVPEGFAEWPTFDAEVFGGHYHGSEPDALRSTVSVTTGADRPILSGIEGLSFIQGGHQYKTGPLALGTTRLLDGKIEGKDPEPVAWTFVRPDGGRSFYAALGHEEDFRQPAFTRLLANAVGWALNRPSPALTQDSTDVTGEARRHWVATSVPSLPKGETDRVLEKETSPVWYRCVVRVPSDWLEAGPLVLGLGSSAQTSPLRAFVNGTELAAGDGISFPIPTKEIVPDDHNLLVLRTEGSTGGLAEAPVLRSADGKRSLALAGTWQFRLGESDTFANMPLPAKFGGGADIVFAPAEPLWVARPVTRPGEFTPGIEGPACERAGNIYAVNFQREGTIGRVSPTGSAEIFLSLPPGSVGNGIRFGRQGEMYVADYKGHNILRVDPATRKTTVLAHEPAMSQPNDIAIADDGTLYASDPNWAASTGQLWRIDPDGRTTLLAKELGTTNGIDVSPDGKTLYCNESGQRNVWAFTITGEKTLTDKRLVRKFEDHGFDGMRIDVDGNLYISRYGKGTVVKMTPAGEILQEIDVLGTRPSNVCFGGPDGRTLYVTEVASTRLVAFRVDRPGHSWRQAEQWQSGESR